MQYLRRLKLLQEDLHNEIKVFKLNYYFRITYKCNSYTEKCENLYWALLKRFLNNKKVHFIPLLFHGNDYVADFKKKS